MSIVIIGTGLAGYTTARELRKIDKETPLTLITADDGGFYSKPMLSNALAQGKTAATLVTTSVEQMAQQLDATILTRTRVTVLEPGGWRIRLGDGTLAYERLVLALGADPIRLPLAGNGGEAVLSVNDLDDYARFRAALPRGGRVVILGAGLIGCEFANDLRNTGHGVHVVDPAAWPLSRLVPEAVGRVLEQALAAAGVGWHLGETVERVERTAGGLRCRLSSGVELEADLVLSAIGLRPRTALAEATGLMVRRGILVDRSLATTATGIHALGDCAEVEGLVLPYVMPIMYAARALARTLAGEPTAVLYPAMPVVVKTPACPTVVAPPPQGATGLWRLEGEGRDRVARFESSAGALLGFVLTGAAVSQRQRLAAELPAVLG